jgi:hypothetical protein
VLDYRANGQRKLVWRSTMAKARKAADEAIDKITDFLIFFDMGRSLAGVFLGKRLA